MLCLRWVSIHVHSTLCDRYYNITVCIMPEVNYNSRWVYENRAWKPDYKYHGCWYHGGSEATNTILSYCFHAGNGAKQRIDKTNGHASYHNLYLCLCMCTARHNEHKLTHTPVWINIFLTNRSRNQSYKYIDIPALLVFLEFGVPALTGTETTTFCYTWVKVKEKDEFCIIT